MKKKILVFAIIISSFATISAQEIGVRLGYSSVSDVAVDGMFNASRYSRFHLNAAFGNGGVNVDVLWDFLFRPLGSDGLYWYLGMGPYVTINDPFCLGMTAEAGLEYRFRGIPVAFGMDWRPRMTIFETTELYTDGFGLNIRYVFGRR